MVDRGGSMGIEGVAGSHRSLFPSSTQNSFVTTPLVKKIKKRLKHNFVEVACVHQRGFDAVGNEYYGPATK